MRSCPSGVIDDIYSIQYYTQGNEVLIDASFTKVGRQLEVIIPSSDLELLPDGILMRRAYYRVSDSSYPDGYYNLEFDESTNVWLGNDNGGSVNPVYVTEDELSSTLSSYATQDWVSSQQFLTSENLPSDIATKSWVQSQGYLTASTIPSDIATEEWVLSQGYVTVGDLPSGLATQSWVESYTYDSSTIDYACGKAEDNAITWVQEQGYLTASTIPSDIATEEWVRSQGYVTVGDLPSGLATQSWVESYTYDKSTIGALIGKAQGDAVDEAQTWVSSQQFATQSWVQSQGYLTSVPSEYATQSWVESYTYDKTAIGQIGQKATGDAIDWVQSQGYLISVPSGYATESWVQSQSYLTNDPNDPFVTESWISSNSYVSTTDLSSYATKSWVSSNYFEESKIWTGTQAQWNALTSAQRATYTIALITQ